MRLRRWWRRCRRRWLIQEVAVDGAANPRRTVDLHIRRRAIRIELVVLPLSSRADVRPAERVAGEVGIAATSD